MGERTIIPRHPANLEDSPLCPLPFNESVSRLTATSRKSETIRGAGVIGPAADLAETSKNSDFFAEFFLE